MARATRGSIGATATSAAAARCTWCSARLGRTASGTTTCARARPSSSSSTPAIRSPRAIRSRATSPTARWRPARARRRCFSS
eukprot:4272860-Prymnesium_polylepis.1